MLASVNPDFLQPVLASSAAWRFPAYARSFLQQPAPGTPSLRGTDWPGRLLWPLLPVAFVEWRYYSVLAPEFHGIVGLALFNPFNRLASLAESGLLCIVAGVFAAPRRAAELAQQASQGELQQLCWMHLFPTASLSFHEADALLLHAQHAGVRLEHSQLSTQHSRLTLCADSGLSLSLEHCGLPGSEIAPCFADDLRRLPAAHWIVYNPSPVAHTSGEINLTREFLASVGRGQASRFPDAASARLQQAADGGSFQTRWQAASGYYEHSFGLNPLSLHGWDFLFVPDAERGQGLVLQTYLNSMVLRYVEVLWQEQGRQCYTRFTADQMRLIWDDASLDPDVQARLPLKRRITARKPGLRLEVENSIPLQIPFLRPEKLAVRHFFISEQIAFCSWRLTDDSGRILAEAHEQPAGGEVAHFRLRVPRQQVPPRQPHDLSGKKGV